MQKRSLTIAGHRTSIALEPEFWEALQAIADTKKVAISHLISQIDEIRTQENLSSAIRVYILNTYRKSS